MDDMPNIHGAWCGAWCVWLAREGPGLPRDPAGAGRDKKARRPGGVKGRSGRSPCSRSMA